MIKNICILNGPNLNMLGQRENDIYGAASLSDIKNICLEHASQLSLEIDFKQSNSEGQLVDWIQEAKDKSDAIIINPAAYTHTSIAIHDALRAVELPIIEVHLSNIYKREDFRHKSFVSPIALGVICGLGVNSYKLALSALAEHDK
jgi:3-dehydroquinate dehydratase-2